MIHYLSLDRVLVIHDEMIRLYGGRAGVLDMGLLESAVAQPQMTFGGVDLHASIEEKAAALCFSVTCNHAFADGNKRTGFGALDLFLRMNGHKIVATTDEIHATFLALADDKMTRQELLEWVRSHIAQLN